MTVQNFIVIESKLRLEQLQTNKGKVLQPTTSVL